MRKNEPKQQKIKDRNGAAVAYRYPFSRQLATCVSLPVYLLYSVVKDLPLFREEPYLASAKPQESKPNRLSSMLTSIF